MLGLLFGGGKLLLPVVIVGAIVGAMLANKLFKKVDASKKGAPVLMTSFQKLIDEQLVVDTLGGPALTDWFNENAGKAQNGAVFMLVKPTAKGAALLGLGQPPKTLNTEYSLLQTIVDKKENLPVAVRLISFSQMPDKLKESFGDQDYLVITR